MNTQKQKKQRYLGPGPNDNMPLDIDDGDPEKAGLQRGCKYYDTVEKRMVYVPLKPLDQYPYLRRQAFGNTKPITHCPNCDYADIEPEHNFCMRCGYDLRPLKTIFPCCGQSQILMHDGWNYCDNCGAKEPFGPSAALGAHHN